MTKPNTAVLSVRFWGVRGSTPSPGMDTAQYGGNTSCVEVRFGDQLLILDAGTGIRGLGDNLAKEFGSRSINAILLISHMHWDHIQGLPFFSPAYSSHNRIRVVGANGRRVMLESALRNQMNPMYFPVGFDEMRGLTGVEELASDHNHIGKVSISVTELNHPGGCAGFRIETDGATIGYLPDHEPYRNDRSETSAAVDLRRKALVDFVRDVDLLILDTQYTEAEYQHRIGWGHGSLPESVALAVEARARRFALFHHDPSHDDRQIDQMIEVAQTLVGASPLVVQGSAENETIILGRSTFHAVNPPPEDLIRIAAV